MIYFYFNTEIRYEVLRQVQRTILSSDAVRRSSAGETLSTRLSTFRRSISRHRQSSIPNRHERRRLNQRKSSPPRPCLCPCWMKEKLPKKPIRTDEQRKTPAITRMNIQENLLPIILDEDLPELTSPLVSPAIKGAIDNEGMTCDTVILKNETEDDEVLSDENDVTIHQSSFHAEPTSTGSNHSPLMSRCQQFQRQRSNSEGNGGLKINLNRFTDRTSLK